MKRLLALLGLVLAAPAVAQTPDKLPIAGETLQSFLMAPGLTVIFAPTADGKLTILSVSEDPHAPVPRNPGQVAVAMSYNPELGTLVEFNSGLANDINYEARQPNAAQPLPTCTVRSDAVGSDQWPQSIPVLVISAVKRHDGKPDC